MGKYVIGLDFGTNTVRALIVDIGNGDEVGTAIFAYPTGDAGIILNVSGGFPGSSSETHQATINIGGSGGTGGLPSPWANQDVGTVGVSGSASYSSGTFTVKGDKLTALAVKDVAGGGLPGILAQLGVKMPLSLSGSRMPLWPPRAVTSRIASMRSARSESL